MLTEEKKSIKYLSSLMWNSWQKNKQDKNDKSPLWLMLQIAHKTFSPKKKAPEIDFTFACT